MMYCNTGCILDRASHTEETMFDFLLNYGSRKMGHDGVASSHPTPTGFIRLTGCQWDPRDMGDNQNRTTMPFDKETTKPTTSKSHKLIIKYNIHRLLLIL